MHSALITGAGGFVGSHVLAALQRQGVAVRALAHSNASRQTLEAAGVETVQGDITDISLLRKALTPTPDVVFHIAADTSMWRKDRKRQWRVNVDGTRAMLGAALDRGVGRFVLTSSISVYGLTPDRIDESSPYRGLSGPIHYARSKAAAEALVQTAGAQGRIRTAVLQPCHILGPGDRHNWSSVAQLLAKRRLPGAPSGIGCFAHVRDVAAAHVAAALHPSDMRTWVLGGLSAPFGALVAAMAIALGVPVPRRTLPPALLWLHALAQEGVAIASGQAPAVTRESVALACHHLDVDDSRARSELAYQHASLQSMADDTVAWLRAAHMLPSLQ